MNEKFTVSRKVFFICIGAAAILFIAVFFAGRASRGSGMEGKISDLVDNVERIAAEMDASLIILNGAADNLAAAGGELDGITETIEQSTAAIIGRIDGVEGLVGAGIDELDRTIERSIEINQGYQEQLDAALGAASGMDEYIERITGYIESIEKGNEPPDL